VISSSGALILVVGPSGAGKDSVLRFAKARLCGDSRFSFPKRVITRLADAASEDHETIDDYGFEALAKGGAFALRWEAHDLKYGVRRTIEDDLAKGRIVSVNVSRAIVADAAELYPVVAVEIFADHDVLAARIAARGRESAEAAARRANRRAPALPVAIPSHKISNNGELSLAGLEFCELLESLAAR
jgi:ribose 1,5-bisphosphokinase